MRSLEMFGEIYRSEVTKDTPFLTKAKVLCCEFYMTLGGLLVEIAEDIVERW